jgi:hypothetical protein
MEKERGRTLSVQELTERRAVKTTVTTHEHDMT